MNYEQIRFTVDNSVGTLLLDRPEARNALSPTMRAEIDDVLRYIRADSGKSIRALVIAGAGGHFCAGGDIKAQHSRAATGDGRPPAMEARQRMRGDHARIQEISNLEIPVIAAVDGAAAGAGFSLALCCDFILASESAYFVQSFGRLGLVPDWNSLYHLPRVVGPQRAKELIYSARRLYAQEALEFGLVLSVHCRESLMKEATRLARRFTYASTTAIGLAKNIVNQAFHLDNRAALEMEAMAQAIARDTSFHREAVRCFVAKDAPLYDWEDLMRQEQLPNAQSPGSASEGEKHD